MRLIQIFCIGCVVPLILFPIFLSLTILSTQVQISACKVESLASSKCLPGSENEIYAQLIYNTNNSILAHYSCTYFNVVSCPPGECESQIAIGETYLCYNPYFTGFWTLSKG